MDVPCVFGGSPKNHHLVLEHLANFKNCSLIRIDNHEDFIRVMRGYSLPCARYMNEVFLKKYFESVFWINKKKDFELVSYEKTNGYSPLKSVYSSFSGISTFVDENSCDEIVLDVDPDTLRDYDTGFSKGLMEKGELKNFINFFIEKKQVKLFFLAESEEFLEELLH
ncbi:MAG: hypothetical protein PHS81_04195 [Candidatus Nanoarchaeia archaeon]|nr:hypothetical protein [Candidatus Nanoarchaeia archaeon]